MRCVWNEERAYRFSDGSLEPDEMREFAVHMSDCLVCRDRVKEAENLEGLLTAGLAYLPAPPALAGRVAAAVAAENQAWRLGWSGPRRLHRRLLAQLAASLLIAVALVAALGGPGAVTALVQRALLSVPGLGISAVDQDTLVLPKPVAVRDGDLELTVQALLADASGTVVEFKVTGLPGGKRGWEPTEGHKPRQPVLRDAAGAQYPMRMGSTAAGGSPEENVITGKMYFPALPNGLDAVELVMPLDYLAPIGVLPEAHTKEWIARLPLVHPAESGLPLATPRTGEATVRDVTLRLLATSLERDQSVLLLEGEHAGESRSIHPGRMGGNPAEEVWLRDDRGRTYQLSPNQSWTDIGAGPFRLQLYFEPVAAGAQEITLSVEAVRVVEDGQADVTLSLAGRRPGETFRLDRVVEIGGHRFRLVSASLVEERGELWLYVDVDLGPTVEGRTLAAVSIQQLRVAYMQSFGAMDGGQMDRFGIALEGPADEVTIRLVNPIVVVEGPWEITLPVEGR